ncbi:MAG: dihydrofolate reductase family protein [Candidatus Woesearchaeota archaeon]
MEELKSRDYKNIMIVRGAKIYETFLREKLVDEILIALHPNILGGGISLTSNLSNKINPKEINCEDSEEGFKLIRYKIKYQKK